MKNIYKTKEWATPDSWHDSCTSDLMENFRYGARMVHCYHWLLVAGLMGTGSASANDLRALYEVALTKDTTLLSAHYQRDSIVEGRSQALSQLLPYVAATGSAVRERVTFDSSVVPTNQSVDCALSASGNPDKCYATARTLGLNLSQTLVNLREFSLLREANSQAASAEAAFRGAQQSLVLRVAQAYFAVLATTDQLATSLHAQQAFGTVLDQAKVREQTGVGPRGDVELAQAYYDAIEQNVIDAQNSLDDAKLAVTAIAGPTNLRFAPLRADTPLTAPEPATVDAWVATASQSNFEVQAAELKAEAAARDISAQRSRVLPTVSLVGSSSKQWQDPVLGGNQRLDTIGVAFSWPIFQGGAVASAVRQSRALYRQAETSVDSLKRDTERRTRAAHRNIVTGAQRIAAAHRAVESGERAVEASRRNVEFGVGSEIDLLNTQTNYFSAVRSFSQVRYDYLTSVLILKQQAGQLTERDLLAVDDMLIETNQ